MAPRNGAPRFELADIVRQHRNALEHKVRLSSEQRRVLTDIGQCRTARLGGHLDVCKSCGYEHPSYNSCRNRHCPKCQALTQERWIQRQRTRMLDVRHFHVVFTLPAQLRRLSRYAPMRVLNALFGCAAQTLLEFGERRLSAKLGVTLVLHTWTRELEYHPHVHAIVTGGGLSHDATTWIATHRRFLFPVKALSRVFRAKMRDALRIMHHAGRFKSFDDFSDPQAFDCLINRIGKTAWYVYAKPSMHGQYVAEYLGRYTHRVGLANSRILDVTDEGVTFRTRGQGQLTLDPVELLRRFTLHVLPARFHKIRHYGLYTQKNLAEQARQTLPYCQTRSAQATDFRQHLLAVTGRDVATCPKCAGALVYEPLPPARAPPPWAA